uniref:B30.2/SPRY domain-containing protein n=1 Tax=Globodera rostochiensis TaxID=31243 RepID=A0A914HCG6_GLORO
MRPFLFLAAVCLLVADASPPPKPNKKRENEPSNSGNAEPDADASPAEIDITPVLTLQNQWVLAADNKDLTLSALSGDVPLVVEHTGNNCGVRSVRAKESIPNEKSGIFYFEVEILAFTGSITMGLARSKLKWYQNVENQGYAYDASGYITGIDFNEKHAFIVRNKIVGETFVGCGVNLATRQIFYTKNGELLGTAKLSDDDELFPSVSMQSNGSKIEANFGSKEFKFDFANDTQIGVNPSHQYPTHQHPTRQHPTHQRSRSDNNLLQP